jgi:hypothetical protein
MARESGGNANLIEYSRSNDWKVGLWQINGAEWTMCSGGYAPCDPTDNLNCALKRYEYGGNTWKMWTSCSACKACDQP